MGVMLLVASEDYDSLRRLVMTLDRGLSRLVQRAHAAGLASVALDAIRGVQRDVRAWWMAQRERLLALSPVE